MKSSVFAFVAVMPGMAVPSAGEELHGGATAESGQAKAVGAESLVVKLQSGADSPRAAVSAFVAASNAGDVEAALRLIDPQVLPLLQSEVLLEEYLLERHLLRNGVMTEQERKSPSNNLGAFPVVYAKRDLLRTVQIDVLKERPSTAGPDRVLLDVDWKLRSWDPSDKDFPFDDIAVTILAVRREDRWYLFHPFGSIYATLLYSDEYRTEGTGAENAIHRGGKADTVLRSEQQDRPDADRRGIAFRVTYRVPIEVVHEQLVVAAQSAEAAELVRQAQNLVRFRNGLHNRVVRGDFRALADLDKALETGDAVFGSLVDRFHLSLQPAVNGLIRRLPQEPPQSKRTQPLRSGGVSRPARSTHRCFRSAIRSSALQGTTTTGGSSARTANSRLGLDSPLERSRIHCRARPPDLPVPLTIVAVRDRVYPHTAANTRPGSRTT
jgi:hypothetical protein